MKPSKRQTGKELKYLENGFICFKNNPIAECTVAQHEMDFLHTEMKIDQFRD